MISIRIDDEKRQRVYHIEPFAWFSWPGELIDAALYALRFAILKTSGKGFVHLDGGPVKCATYRYHGNELQGRDRITGVLTPVRRCMIFESAADYRRYTKE